MIIIMFIIIMIHNADVSDTHFSWTSTSSHVAKDYIVVKILDTVVNIWLTEMQFSYIYIFTCVRTISLSFDDGFLSVLLNMCEDNIFVL